MKATTITSYDHNTEMNSARQPRLRGLQGERTGSDLDWMSQQIESHVMLGRDWK